MTGRRRRFTDADLVEKFRQPGMTNARAAQELGAALGVVLRHKKRLGLTESRADRQARARTRHAARPLVTHAPAPMLPIGNPALLERRTIYPKTVRAPGAVKNLLVEGHNHHKLGSIIRKGPWAGFPIYALTLEERATCPVSCQHWRSCYGNQMHMAHRIDHRAGGLEARLEGELTVLQSRFPGGFAVRLHVLGDFYSVAYVQLWRLFLARFPALHVFGFTARVDQSDPICRELVHLVLARWDRFAIRFSNAPVDECATVTIEHPISRPPDAVVCPQQLGLTENCGTCGLCWNSRRRIAFLRH